MRLGFGMRLTPLAGFGLVSGYSRERGFLFDRLIVYLLKQVVKINLDFMPEQVYGNGWRF